MEQTARPHSSHWGAYEAIVERDAVVDVRPYAGDADPSPLLRNIPGTVRHRSRIAGPMIRSGWLERGPGADERRGAEPFVPVGWDTLTEVLAGEITRVIAGHGSGAIYGGSYGWASAGRFHHAQSQVHRFLNLTGGYVSSVDTYSNAAGEVILDRVLGRSRSVLFGSSTTWPHIVANTDTIVAFGGIPLKNTFVSPGGQSRHNVRAELQAAADRGLAFVLFSPLRDDLPATANAEWHALAPGTDVAVMLGLAHALVLEGRHDRAFLDRYCTGYGRFERYLLGLDDGTPKSADWAAGISGISAETIRALARRMASGRTLINVSWSLQRADHGEQAPWMGLTLAAMLGQLGLPGGGYGFGYGSMGNVGEPTLRVGLPTFRQGRNPVKSFIPVARVADMLLHPGEPFDYNGRKLTYPDIKLVYWAGGNPFHHHQDLGRLRRAFSRAETIVVHDPFWTPAARHADIVVPSTMSLERDDIGSSSNDPVMVAMKRAVAPYARSRNDYDTFSDLAHAMGFGDAFTERRDAGEWLRFMYDDWRASALEIDPTLPEFADFWARGYIELPRFDDQVSFSAFRDDPFGSALKTPSGKIEIFSETIAGFGYDDCWGHPAWFAPKEWLGSDVAERFPLQLVANNPATRLHSQLDGGEYSQLSKIQGREPVRINPLDAEARGIVDGDVVRLVNERGSCLAGARVSDAVRPGVVQLSTGAWYDPVDPGDLATMCGHGNPNVLTFDKGTSKLAQGCAGQLALVQVERYEGDLPPIRAYDPPPSAEPPAGLALNAAD
ncbi:MAG: molybdopterin-dependent oxidoreductase [Thermomicrobiales bacterium]|nr:molybdopterin-dependent oxidoreductase [Thermomicrobiales bacterium]